MISLVPAYIATAALIWGPAPCGTVTVQRAELRPLIGFADLDACVISVDRRWWRSGGVEGRPYECTLIVHEYGHLVGMQHTARGVMSPNAGAPTRRCLKFAPKNDRSPRHR